MEEKATKISGFVAKYYKKNHTIPSIATIIKALEITRVAFYQAFPGGIKEVCDLIGVPSPKERLERTEQARVAKMEALEKEPSPEFKPDEEMRRLEGKLRKLELKERKQKGAELRAQRKREMRREMWEKQLDLEPVEDLVVDYIEKMLPRRPIKAPLEECRKRLELKYGENFDTFDVIFELFDHGIEENLHKWYRDGDDLLRTFDRAVKTLVGKELVKPFLKNHDPFICPICKEKADVFSVTSGTAVMKCCGRWDNRHPYYYWCMQCPNCGELMGEVFSPLAQFSSLRCRSFCGIVWRGEEDKDAPSPREFMVPVQRLEGASYRFTSKRSTKYFLYSYTIPS